MWVGASTKPQAVVPIRPAMCWRALIGHVPVPVLVSRRILGDSPISAKMPVRYLWCGSGDVEDNASKREACRTVSGAMRCDQAAPVPPPSSAGSTV
jgi:hypothetical protein